MEQLHAHEVLRMMEGKNYTEESLKTAIKHKFGENQLFYTCSAQGMNIDTLIIFLKERGKFLPTDGSKFTVDIDKVCDH